MKTKKVKLLLVFLFVLFIVLSNTGTANARLVIPELWERISNTYLMPKTATWNLGATTSHIPAGYFDNIYSDNAEIGTITINTASEGAFTIDVTDPEAFLIRKDADAGDLAVFDTTNFDIGFFGDVDISGSSLGVDATEKILLSGLAGNTYILESSADELSFFAGGSEGLRIDFNELEVQPLMTLAVGPIELEEDSGAVTLVNLPVSATPADGDEESMSFAIDSNEVLKIYGEADSAGGADTFKVLTTGQITSSYTGSAGWSVIANTTPDTTTCIESCTFACLFGWDDTGATILDCSSTVPDKCVCMGAS